METWLAAALAALLQLGGAPESAGVPLRAMSFNIRYDEPGDGADAWPLRRELVAGLVRFHRPDVVGLQEALAGQVDDLTESLPGYGAFGQGRDGEGRGERCTILFRRERLELVRQGTFWLSRTPDRPGPDWGAKLSRICTWGTLRENASGRLLHVFNTHLDHQSAQARREGARLVRTRAAELAPEGPVVLLGDFNCDEASEPYALLVGRAESLDAPAFVDAAEVAREPGYGPSGTFSGFSHGGRAGRRIDHVLVRGPLRVERHAVLSDTRDGRTPSDHRPVLADLLLGVPFETPRLELRTGWRFLPLAPGASEPPGLERPGFDDGDWQRLLAGETWERQGHEGLDGVGWYRRRARVPAAWRGRGVHLTWPGVEDELTLWVNGELVLALGPGSSRSAPRTVAVRLPEGLLHFDGEDLLAFRVEDAGGSGGLAVAPPALEVGRAASTHWAARYRSRTLLEDAAWPSARAGAEPHAFRLTLAAPEGAESWLVIDARGAGAEPPVLRLRDGGGELVRESADGSELEHRVEAGGVWTLEVLAARGALAAGRLDVTLWAAP